MNNQREKNLIRAINQNWAWQHQHAINACVNAWYIKTWCYFKCYFCHISSIQTCLNCILWWGIVFYCISVHFKHVFLIHHHKCVYSSLLTLYHRRVTFIMSHITIIQWQPRSIPRVNLKSHLHYNSHSVSSRSANNLSVQEGKPAMDFTLWI